MTIQRIKQYPTFPLLSANISPFVSAGDTKTTTTPTVGPKDIQSLYTYVNKAIDAKDKEIGDINNYLARLFRALSEESTTRIGDFDLFKLAHVPYIDARQCGVVADGTTDDTAAWNSALTTATGGVLIYYNTGNASIVTNTGTMANLLTIPSKTTLIGIGMPTIKLKSGSTCTNIIRTADTPENSEVHVEGIIIDGNKAGQTGAQTMNGLRLDNCRRSTAERVYVKDVYAVDPLTTEGTGFSIVDCNDVLVDRCWASGIGGMGIYVGNASISNTQVIVSNCTATGCATFGFSPWNVYDAKFIGCHSYANVGAINVENCGHVSVVSLDAYLNSLVGIWINESCDCLVSSCISYNTTGPGIYVTGTDAGTRADRNQIIGNRCFDTRTPKLQTYGCQEGAYADYNVFAFNHVANNLTDGIVLVGSNSRNTGNYTTDYMLCDIGQVRSIAASHHYEMLEGANAWWVDVLSDVWRVYTDGAVKFAIDNAGGIRTASIMTPFNTLGNVVKKLPIYDESGTLKGYIPIYDAITQV